MVAKPPPFTTEYGAGIYQISGGVSGAFVAINVGGTVLTVAGSLVAILDSAFALAKIGGSFQPLFGAAIAYTGLLLSIFELSASCGLAALPIMLATALVTGVSIGVGFSLGGPIGLSLALQAASVVLGGLLSKLSEVCRDGGL